MKILSKNGWQPEKELKAALCGDRDARRLAQVARKNIETWVDDIFTDMLAKGLLEKTVIGGATFYRTSHILKSLYDAFVNWGGSA